MSNFPTKFKYDPQYLQDRFEDHKFSFNSRNPNQDYTARLYELTAEFVRAAKHNYLRFGPYWDGVRNILFNHFKHLDFQEMHGGSFMPMFYNVKKEGSNETDEVLTLVAAWEFKSEYDKQYFQGSVDFQLWDDPERWWNATDPYWEFLFDCEELPRD